MSWFYLILAGVFEIGWAICLKLSAGLTRPWPVAGMLISLVISAAFLALSLKTIPLSTAYAVWTGIGAAGTVVVGIGLFAEPAHPTRIVCIGLVILGVIGLKLAPGG
jgi:quaternary ammonium compound-resistance protein SugE